MDADAAALVARSAVETEQVPARGWSSRRCSAFKACAACVCAWLLATQASYAQDTKLQGKTFAEILAANETWTEKGLLKLVRAGAAEARQFALLQLAERSPRSPAAIDTLVGGLLDPSVAVRTQALAGLMRLSGRAPQAALRGLTDFRSAGIEGYASEARNGWRTLPITMSSLVFAALSYSAMDVCDDVISAYQKKFGAGHQDDFIHARTFQQDSSMYEDRFYEDPFGDPAYLSDRTTVRKLLVNLRKEASTVQEAANGQGLREQFAADLAELQKTLQLFEAGQAPKQATRRHFERSDPFSFITATRQWSGSPWAVRQRLLDAAEALCRKPTKRLISAGVGADEHLRLAVLRAVRKRKIRGAGVNGMLEKGVREGGASVRGLAARLLSKQDAEGEARLARVILDGPVAARTAALEAFPVGSPAFASHVERFLGSKVAAERRAALRRLATVTRNSCGDDGELAREAPLVDELLKRQSANLEALLLGSEDSVEIGASAVLLACADRDRREQLANKLALALPTHSGRRLSVVAGLLEELTRTNSVSGRAVSIHVPDAKTAVAQAMARASNTQVDEPSARALARTFRTLNMSREEATALMPFAVQTVLSENRVERDAICHVMKRQGIGDAFFARVLSGLPSDDNAVYLLYIDIADCARQLDAFQNWQRGLLGRPHRKLAAQAALDAAQRDGASPLVISVLLRVLATAHQDRDFWTVGSRATKQLLALGEPGVQALLGLLAGEDLESKTRRDLFKALSLEKNPQISAFVLAAARDGTRPERQAAALSGLVGSSSPEARQILLDAMDSPHAEVRLAAVKRDYSNADEMLARASADPDPLVQAAGMELVPYLKKRAPGDFVRKALLSPHEGVRKAAYAIMFRLPAETVASVMAEAAEASTTLPADFVDALGRVDKLPAELYAALEEIARSPDQRTAERAKNVLKLNYLRAFDAGQTPRFLVEEKQTPPTADQIDGLKKDLRSPEPRHRMGAASALVQAGADPWSDGGLIARILMEASVGRTVSTRLGATLDFLQPPSFGFTSSRMELLPVLPWPPPPGYSVYSIPRQLFVKSGATSYGDVYRTLVRTLGRISDNFEHGLFAGPPDGFAVVARLERVRVDGTPYPEPGRWVKDGRPALDFFDLMGDLFFSQPGYFRTIVFAVTSSLVPGSDAKAILPEPGEGAKDMPPELASKSFGDNLYLLAMVYGYERKLGARIQPWRDGAPSAQRHLTRAGVLTILSR